MKTGLLWHQFDKRRGTAPAGAASNCGRDAHRTFSPTPAETRPPLVAEAAHSQVALNKDDTATIKSMLAAEECELNGFDGCTAFFYDD